jgi:hypothetical protein
MTDLEKAKKYFCIEELVDKEVFEKYGQSAWKFLDKTALSCLIVVREGIGFPMTVNNWKWGGKFSQRGLRHNMSPLVKRKTRIYLSAHIFGKAFDFDVQGMSSIEVRKWIVENELKFPCNIRLERNQGGKPINWVHLDTMSTESAQKVYLFDV